LLDCRSRFTVFKDCAQFLIEFTLCEEEKIMKKLVVICLALFGTLFVAGCETAEAPMATTVVPEAPSSGKL